MKIFLYLLLLTNVCFGFKEYYSLTKSIRALGMGGAFYSLSDDEQALFYNPAGLSIYRGESQLMLNIGTHLGSGTLNAVSSLASLGNANLSRIITQLQSYQGTPLYMNVGLMPFYLKKNFAVGLLIGETKVQLGLLGKELDTSIEVNAISDSALAIGYAREVAEDLHIGFTLKGILRAGGKKTYSVLDIAQNSTVSLDPNSIGGIGAGIDCDLGAIYEVRGLPFGFLNQVSATFNNLFASSLSLMRIGGAPPTLSRTFALGFRSVFSGIDVVDNFHVLLDFANFGLGGESDPDYGARVGSFWKHVNLGVEAPIKGWFILRTGFHQGSFTFGVGIQTSYLKLDFASYGEELGLGVGRLTGQRYAVRLALGMGSPAPSPVFARDAIPEEYRTHPEPPAPEPVEETKSDTVKEEEKKVLDSELDEFSKNTSDEKSQQPESSASSTEEKK